MQRCSLCLCKVCYSESLLEEGGGVTSNANMSGVIFVEATSIRIEEMFHHYTREEPFSYSSLSVVNYSNGLKDDLWDCCLTAVSELTFLLRSNT